MKKITKALALVLTIAMLAALLAGCGSSKPTSTPDASNPDASTPSEPADDTVYTLNIDFPNPETAVGYGVLVEWADYLREQSNGRLDIKIYSGGALGSLFDCVTNCESGVTDGFWSGVTIYAGAFPITEVFGLPMLGAKNYNVINAAMNAMLEEFTDMSSEWDNLYVVTLHSSTGSPILFADDIGTIEGMKGKNLRISNAYTTEWFTKLGANPVSLGINDGYEGIQKSIIQGGLFFFDQVQSSALYEVIDSIYVGETIYPLNMLCLNKNAYEKLPEDLKALVDGSGDFFLERSIEAFDAQKEYLLGVLEENDVNIILEDDASREFLNSQAQAAWTKWVDTMNGLGYDGQAILDKALEYIAEFNETLGD